ncbi:hypothetical protein [Klebsiella huaxiensis]|nr:hypothetical protein [Klebsiella huaxiensis]
MAPNAVDEFSGASVLQKLAPETGSAQYVALFIEKRTQGDLFRIETT